MSMLMEKSLYQQFEKEFANFAFAPFGAITTLEYYMDYKGPPPLRIQIDQDKKIITNQKIRMDDRDSFVEDFERNHLFRFLKGTGKPFIIEVTICNGDTKCRAVLGSNLDSYVIEK